MKKYLLLFVLLLSLAAVISQIPDPYAHIVICDVGQGDGILITKGMTQIVIDAGPDNSIEHCLGSHMPFWDRTIEVAVMSHMDSDHSYGFSQLFERYTVQYFFGNPIDGGTASTQFEHLKQIVAESKTTVLSATRGKEIKVNGINLVLVSPPAELLENLPMRETIGVLGSRSGDTNDLCSVIFMQYLRFSALFSCDVSPKTEAYLVKHGLIPNAYLLKISHHGSKNGTTREFLNAVRPHIAAISVAAKNKYKFPSPELIDLLHNAGVQIKRTDQNGEIEVKTDGTHIWSN